jgi:hypothetical protein
LHCQREREFSKTRGREKVRKIKEESGCCKGRGRWPVIILIAIKFNVITINACNTLCWGGGKGGGREGD